uniref:Pentatricopeptide repeat-containing protein n=1 Tax=Solanum tuberosum TaxID=4113 RepID=M1AP69_SOLTU
MNFNRCMMIQQVGWNIQSTIAKAYPKVGSTLPWITLCEKLVNLKPVSNLSIVCWKFPENGVLKLKTDGSYCSASGKSGMRGVLRGDRGNLILAFSSPSSCCSST